MEEDILDKELLSLYNYRPNIKEADKKYFASEKWKCENSPTKAHHWICQKEKRQKDLIISYEKCSCCIKERIIVNKDHN